ncbi:DNA topoisomerase I [Methanotorris formicicus]|uniref:DNA topoisomerase 1 n=1 Tax=Methanotorris formicicus Mc-S-70 TaxID=647171 RepID=H1KZF4_9EURY|nr:DNA topoisomerase I [Methanotorris formicicus]EHP86074.1 DNA topoisomerase I [Methanotorris formicicus Mc-S-70]
MVALIICEKPSVAKKIAEALGKPKKKSIYSVPYYELERDGKKILAASAVGHLFTLVEKKEGKFGEYPVFDIDWVPASIEEGKKYVENYIKALKKLSKEADEFYVATDWDIEGELIGYHALYYCCGKTNAKRMRFSSLTKKEIIKAYENPDTIDFGLVDAGDSRHKVDWYFGINVSRALMEAIRAVKRWKTMSTGRVQGPALAFLVDRELEIKKFVPKPYWVISALLDNLNAIHEKEKFWDEKEANHVYEKIKDIKEGIVVGVKKRKKKIKPNPPFDLGTLQREAHSIYKFSPKKTQDIAQRLYERGIVSYPRSSSQKLPKDRKYLEDVLSIIKNHPNYGKYAERILNENLKPIEGKKDDPAHPAIHIVDIPKEKLPEEEEKIYDLIARRTLAAFWDDAEREYCNVTIDIGGEKFKLNGSRTVKEGWHEIYHFTRFDEVELPPLKKNEKIKVEKINIERKETKPPKRYTVASIIKELEARKLGTKATRAEIIDKLISRGYVVEDGSLKVTDLGIAVIETLKKFCPEIIDEKMTRDLEEKLELIQNGKIKKDEVLNEAENKLKEILSKFKEKEKEIGKELVSKIDSTNKKLKTIGKCKCGGDLVIIRTKNSRFVGCTNYPECNVTYSLPKKGRIKVLNETCESCGLPVIGIDGQKLCINPECPSKMPKENIEDLKESISNGEKTCPKCGGKLVVKNGIYGAFLGCENYPKCKYTEKIKKEVEVVGKCPKCGGDLVKRRGKYGEFIGCSNYPKCKYIEKIKK